MVKKIEVAYSVIDDKGVKTLIESVEVKVDDLNSKAVNLEYEDGLLRDRVVDKLKNFGLLK
ncbi:MULTISPECIES: hypothetical protein [Klebsiella pneumoniae complex]|uniref:hypothetical protein n=1 Tax=Klebsiella pneumoniae complex TaxID=3390273 RepID=UPI0009D402CE|nr:MULTISPECIES: hypothetical protein [Klebsiella]HCI4229513.1 hypothetical protein [Klebsiella quasipneumoniae subsp. similipneumoniae]HDS9649500.1 hypothetical protein [Klebsiella pneumoniae subsp. pneumoniae]MBE5051502.1 hypothetical protein [Klebsiella pneumoniae]MBK4940431.1 hypothetical protein [Klebsiella pneumoniae]UZH15302.1 hypothetical protein JMX37_02960 [Klebsiella pneumoniae]